VVEAFSQFPWIEILVNNAGVNQNKIGDQATLEDFVFCYDVNVKNVWSVSRAFIPYFRNHNEGKIINISLVAGRRGHSANAYCASKSAVISLTQSLAAELGPCNINVNAISPGIIWTAIFSKVEEVNASDEKEMGERQANKNGIGLTVLDRPQLPEDIGCAAVFLASSKARNITGQSLNVDGGICMN
jgi:NAD(P)-dependent dehydrogenase (short-subunit alcohol dehydrogenase family)